MRKLLKKNDGYTLLEVVVSMLVLAIIAAPIGSAFVVSARVNASTRTIITITGARV